MKKFLLIVLLIPAFVFAQKPVKPNLNKALSSMQDGKLAEAKDMIDAATTYEKTMNDGKTWYYRGLIYSCLDTTSNPAYKTLSPNALSVAIESFKKADAMASGGKEYFINDPNDIASAMNNTKPVQLGRLCDYYLNKGITLFQLDEPDFAGCIVQLEKAKQVFENLTFNYTGDTTTYYVLIFAAENSEKYDTAITAANKVVSMGGTSAKVMEAYRSLIRIYSGPKADKNKALEIARSAKEAFPTENEFSLSEIQLLVDLEKIDEAKAGLEAQIAKDPNNKVLHFFLGHMNLAKTNLVEAKKNFEAAIKIDPKYFEAQVYLSRIVGADAKLIKKQMNALGITAADKKKKMELDGVYVQKLKVALPYWEQAEKLNPSDEEVLTELYSIYSDLGNDAQVQRITKRMKELGIE